MFMALDCRESSLSALAKSIEEKSRNYSDLLELKVNFQKKFMYFGSCVIKIHVINKKETPFVENTFVEIL